MEDRKKKRELKEDFEQTKGTNESVTHLATSFFSMINSKKAEQKGAAGGDGGHATGS